MKFNRQHYSRPNKSPVSFITVVRMVGEHVEDIQETHTDTETCANFIIYDK